MAQPDPRPPCLRDTESSLTTLDTAISQCNATKEDVDARKGEVDGEIQACLDRIGQRLKDQSEGIRARKTASLDEQKDELERVKTELLELDELQLVTPEERERAERLQEDFDKAKHFPTVSSTFITALTNPDDQAIERMTSHLGAVSGGVHAPSSTCDAGFLPRAVLGKERTIRVVTKNDEDQLHGLGGAAVEARLVFKRLEGEDSVQGTTTDHGDGSYSISFTPRSQGQHILHVTVDNHPVKGSPFQFLVTPPKKSPHIPTHTRPSDVAVTREGDLAVAEFGSHTVSLYSSEDGQRVHTFGEVNKPGREDGQFDGPSALAIRGDLMYVCEVNNHRVQKFRVSGREFISKFGGRGEDDGEFSAPKGICLDSEGRVFVADHGNNRIQVFSEEGKFAYSIECRNSPWGLTFDPQGQLHVAVHNANCIHVFSTDQEGTFKFKYGDKTVRSPAGITIDAEGCITVSQNMGGTLWVFRSDHTHSYTLTGQFANGRGMAYDHDGNFWVADYTNSRITRY